MMAALQLGGVGMRPAARLTLPLDYLWWRVLGYLP